MSQHHATILAHQFDDLAQQREASTLGMWAFLATEVMFFGGALAAYAVYRHAYPVGFALASREENWFVGAVNTAVLLCSSLSVALAVHAAQHGDNRRVVRWLFFTIALGLIFVTIKAFEYDHIIDTGHAPWLRDFRFEPHAEAGAAAATHDPAHVAGVARAARMFFSFYFAMTGLHALHMFIGIGLMIWVIRLARRNRFSHEYYTPVEMTGLYWHFVDIVWIFLYPLLYLVGRHG